MYESVDACLSCAEAEESGLDFDILVVPPSFLQGIGEESQFKGVKLCPHYCPRLKLKSKFNTLPWVWDSMKQWLG
jgi:hypothetical protein